MALELRDKVYNRWLEVKARLKCLTWYEQRLITNLAIVFLHSTGVNIAKQMKENQVTPLMIKEVNKNFTDKCLFPLLTNPERYPNLAILNETFIPGIHKLLDYCQKVKEGKI